MKLPVHRVENTLKLLEGGATIPFISRYRKEATGGMDEVQIGEIQARNEKLGELSPSGRHVPKWHAKRDWNLWQRCS